MTAPRSTIREFFLALARCGKDAWNKWRAGHSSGRAKSDINVAFANVDFRAAEIDLSGF